MENSPEKITAALNLLTSALRRYVPRRMEASHGAKGMQVARDSLRNPRATGKPLDLSALLTIATNNQKALGIEEQDAAIVREIKAARNGWAHQEAFSSEDLYRALDGIRRILKLTGEPEFLEVEESTRDALKRLCADTSRVVSAIGPTAVSNHEGPTLAHASGTGSRSVAGPMKNWQAEELLAKFVEVANNGRPHVASYSWAYQRLFGKRSNPWSQGDAAKVVNTAQRTSRMTVAGLGPVALDTFIVGAASGVPSQGHWRSAGYDQSKWEKRLHHAVLLHGAKQAPWE